jgi:hypothetical protein
MSSDFAKRRRLACTLGSLLAGSLLFSWAIHWDIDALGLSCVFAFVSAAFLAMPVRICEGCGKAVINTQGAPSSCSECHSKFVWPEWGLFSVAAGRSRLPIEIALALILLFFSFRFLSLAVLLLHIALGMPARSPTRNRRLNITAVIFLVLLLLPVDVEIGGFHGHHFGVARSGPRFVRLVMGLPMTRRCIERYGDFISGGCCVMGNEPQWLFVWERVGLRTSKPDRPGSAEGAVSNQQR